MTASHWHHRFFGLILIGMIISSPGILWAQSSAPSSVTGKNSGSSQFTKAAEDPVVISVGGQEIKASEFEQLIAVLPLPQQKELSSTAARRSYAENLIHLLALSRAAETEKLELDPLVAAQLRWTRLQLLAAAEQQVILRRTVVTEAEVQKFFDQNRSRFAELHLLHISVPIGNAQPAQVERIRKEMESLRLRARSGEDFRKLVREYSKDSDAQQGGDLGFLGRGHFGEALDNAVFNLRAGQVTEVLDAPGGIHLFKAIAERTQSLGDAHEAIVEMIRNQRLQAMLPGLVREMQPMLNETYFANTGKGIDLSSMPIEVTVEKDGKVVKKTGPITIKPAEEKKKNEKK